MTTPVVRGRYAPSPTGETHLGNARTALLAWLQVREHNGVFVLRLEDLDTGRVRPGLDEALLRDLAWLGLDWDEGWDVGGPHGPYRQSERLQMYQAALERLPTYPCSCSRKEIAEEIASAPHGPEQPYPGTCRNGPKHPTRPMSRRLRVPPQTLAFDDVRFGAQQSGLEDIGDFVLQRNDGVFAYQLACALDDAAMKITHVTRGEDLLQSTPRQILILKLLGLPVPRYGHVPLLRDVAGERLAKRNKDTQSLRALRDGGASPQRIVRELAQSLGWDVQHDCTPKDLLGFFGAWPTAINP